MSSVNSDSICGKWRCGFTILWLITIAIHKVSITKLNKRVRPEETD